MAARAVRRAVLLSAGWGLILVGVVLLFLPGPGIVFIFAGVGLLATEFAWARVWMKRMKDTAGDVAEDAREYFHPRRKDPPG